MWAMDLLASTSLPLLALICWVCIVQRSDDTNFVRGPGGCAVALALVLAWLQLGGMFLSFLGWLSPVPTLLWIFTGLSGLLLWGRPLDWKRGWSPPPRESYILLLAWLPIVLLALVPPWYRDSMVYHLALPRQYAMAGGAIALDDNIFASFPLGYESILSVLYVGRESADYLPVFNPRLVGAWVGLGAALATVSLARILGAGNRSSWLAGIVMVLVPTWQEFGASAYVEPYLVLLTVSSLIMAVRFLEGVRGSWPFLALFLGLAAGVKYPGMAVLFFVLAGLLLVKLFELRRTEADPLPFLRTWLPLVLLALLIASPFYIRNLFERGNPVFPLLYDVFGGEGWDPSRGWMYGETLRNYGAGRDFGDYLLLPWRLFTTMDMRDVFEGSIGPLPLVVILIGLWRLFRESRPSRQLVAGFGLVWAFFWASNVQQVRFFLVGLSPLLAIGVWGVDMLSPRIRKVGFVAVVSGMVGWCLGPYGEIWERQQTGDFLTGAVTEDEVMDSVMPWTSRVYRELSDVVPEDGRIWLVHTRAHTYYLEREYRLDCVFEEWRFVELLGRGDDTTSFETELRNQGLTHLLIFSAPFLTTVDDTERERLALRFRSMIDRGLLVEEERWPIRLEGTDKAFPMMLYRVSLDSES